MRIASLLLLSAVLLGTSDAHAVEVNKRVARLGFVGPGTPFTAPRGIAEFWNRLRELGWIRGQNLIVEERWAEGQLDRLPGLMDEIVSQKVDVIATYATAGGIAAKRATSTIPIVDAIMGDPVEMGLVVSLSHPGGNLTGLSAALTEGFPGKWLELLQETVPRISTFAVIMHPNDPLHAQIVKNLEAAAATRRLKLRYIEIRDAEAIKGAIDQARRQAKAALVLPSAIFLAHRQQIAGLTLDYRLPTMFAIRDYVDAGGLMAYGPDFKVMFRRAAEYVDKILNGVKPSDLPIEQPTRYCLIVNLKTAKAIKVKIPESILIFADEVIR